MLLIIITLTKRTSSSNFQWPIIIRYGLQRKSMPKEYKQTHKQKSCSVHSYKVMTSLATTKEPTADHLCNFCTFDYVFNRNVIRCKNKLSNRSFPSLRVRGTSRTTSRVYNSFFIEIIMLFKHVDDSFQQYANNRVYVFWTEVNFFLWSLQNVVRW